MTDSSTQQQTREPQERGWNALVQVVSTKKIEFGLWCTRLTTIIFAFCYVFPFFTNPYSAYYKTLMANAATSALRLHQRLPRVQFTREFLQMLLIEDSAHYLFYSLIFLNCEPITVALMPVTLFAILHAASFSLTLLDALGQNSWWGARMLISLVELQSRNTLRMVAFVEIFLMPLVVIFIFTGRASILSPFLYYRFLGMRYVSRRNPYTRAMFQEMRLALEEVAANQSCPQGARTMIFKMIGFISNLAPVAQPQQQ